VLQTFTFFPDGPFLHGFRRIPADSDGMHNLGRQAALTHTMACGLRMPKPSAYVSCTWFGVISSTASAVGSVIIESKTMLRVGSVHQETFGGYIDGDGGIMARRKVSKLVQIIFNNQQSLVVALEGSGRWGAMTTVPERCCPCPRTRRPRHNDHRRHRIPSCCSCRHHRLEVAGFAEGVGV